MDASPKLFLLRYGHVKCVTGFAQACSFPSDEGGGIIWYTGAMFVQLAARPPAAVSVEEGHVHTLRASPVRMVSFMIALFACADCTNFTQHIFVMASFRHYINYTRWNQANGLAKRA